MTIVVEQLSDSYALLKASIASYLPEGQSSSLGVVSGTPASSSTYRITVRL
jgi:hypothetical protein